MSAQPDAGPEIPVLELASADAWDEWLSAHHETSPGVWLRLAKRGAPRATLTYASALEVALCHGWIDAQKRGLDEHFWLQRFTPRGRRSRWSLVNTEHAERLIAAGRMRPAGLAAVAAAKADGRWQAAYEPQSRATPDDDFAAALAAVPAAQAFFEALPSAQRYAFLYRLRHIKRPETRKKRVAEYVEMLAAGRTLHDGR